MGCGLALMGYRLDDNGMYAYTCTPATKEKISTQASGCTDVRFISISSTWDEHRTSFRSSLLGELGNHVFFVWALSVRSTQGSAQAVL